MFFHRERTSENGPTTVAASQIPVGSILGLLGSSSESIMVHHSSVQRHHSSLLCYSSVLSHSIVLHESSMFRHHSVLDYSLSTIRWHVIMLLYNSTSSNNLATDVNTPCQLFNCIVEILVLATAAYRTFRHPSMHLFCCRGSASLTSFKSMFGTLQLNY